MLLAGEVSLPNAEHVSLEVITNDQLWQRLFAGGMAPEDFFQKKYRDPMYTAAKAIGVILRTRIRFMLTDTTLGWRERPRFPIITELEPGLVRLRVFVDGSGSDNWLRINYGTRPHTIPKGGRFPKGKRVLIRPYLAKTQPGSAVSNAGGGVYGNIEAQASIINHPGITAREFTKQIADQLRGFGSESVAKRVQSAIQARIQNIVNGTP